MWSSTAEATAVFRIAEWRPAVLSEGLAQRRRKRALPNVNTIEIRADALAKLRLESRLRAM